MRQWFFYIHIFAGFHGPDGSQTMPMIARGHDNRVNTVRGNQITQVKPGLSFRVVVLHNLDASGVGVTESGDINAFDLRELFCQLPCPSSTADKAKVNRIIRVCGPKFPGGQRQHHARGKSRCQKPTPSKVYHFSIRFRMDFQARLLITNSNVRSIWRYNIIFQDSHLNFMTKTDLAT